MILYKSKYFFSVIFFSSNVSNINSLKCVSVSNREYKIRPKIISINSNEPSFYPYSVNL